jgi:chromosomal replication initiator protein
MSQTEVSAAADLWSRLIETFSAQIPEQTLTTWIRPLLPQKLEGNQLFLQVPSNFHREWIEGHYVRELEFSLRELCGEEIRLRLVVVAKKEKPQLPAGVALPREETPARIAAQAISSAEFDSRLNPRYSFDTFVEGDSNSFARATCVAVADHSRKTLWNPLLIYGGTGLGKTHLLQAVGNQVLRKNRSLRVLYVSSEKFTQDFIHALQHRTTADFSHTYRSIDMLLVDDIQFFAAKERTQVEFFHAFNTLYQNGKRIVLTSDRPVTELAGFDERLISRFASGLVTNINPPDYEMRVAILLRRAEEDGFQLANDVADLIATHITANVRELEGAYITLVARCQLLRLPATVDLAREIIRDKTGHVAGHPPVEKIQDAVAEFYHLPVESLRGKSRKKEIVLARMVAMTLMTELTSHSLKTIGSFFGGRDHSTVIHARDTINALRTSKDQAILDAFQTLERKLSLSTQSRINGG